LQRQNRKKRGEGSVRDSVQLDEPSFGMSVTEIDAAISMAGSMQSESQIQTGSK